MTTTTTATTSATEAPVLYVRTALVPGDAERLAEWRQRPHARIVVCRSWHGPDWRGAVTETLIARDTLGAYIDAFLVCFHDEPVVGCWCSVPLPDVIAEAAQRLRTKLYPERLHPGYPAGHSVINMPRHLSVLISDSPDDAVAAGEYGIAWLETRKWRAGRAYPEPPRG